MSQETWNIDSLTDWINKGCNIDLALNVTKLDISASNLTDIPEQIFQLHNLKLLFLHNNMLTTIPLGIGQLKQLKTLNCYGNLITQLPPDIGELTSLQYLFVNDNMLRSLPDEITNLSNLTCLWCYGNNLSSLPNDIHKLSKLEILLAYHNSLKSISNTIGQILSLKKLNLNNNQLTRLPYSIIHIPGLEQLEIDHNPLFFGYIFGNNYKLDNIQVYRKYVQFIQFYLDPKIKNVCFYYFLRKRMLKFKEGITKGGFKPINMDHFLYDDNGDDIDLEEAMSHFFEMYGQAPLKIPGSKKYIF